MNSVLKKLTQSTLVRRIRAWWIELDPTTRSLAAYIWRAANNFSDYGARWAAALAYYTIFSLFPLTLLAAIGVSRVLGAAATQQQISSALGLFLPESSQATSLFLDSIQQALEQDTSFGIVALIGLAWSGLGLFSNLTSSLDLIFRVPRSRSIWRQRLVALIMFVVLVVLVTASFLTSGVIALLSLLSLGRAAIWLTMASWFLPFSLNMLIFVLLFRFVPARSVHWDAIWPAALVGAAGFELAKRGFSWYLTNVANYQVVYGSIATVIVLLFWAYLLASVFLFSAELCAQVNEWISLRDHEQALLPLETKTPPQRRR
ncbi:MAG: YihY/virulence factor BrkB family protein [Anaerolineae bacterium]|nr:YihY/virulence factor BrkB family protein [Anaerolineae bacterium]